MREDTSVNVTNLIDICMITSVRLKSHLVYAVLLEYNFNGMPSLCCLSISLDIFCRWIIDNRRSLSSRQTKRLEFVIEILGWVVMG